LIRRNETDVIKDFIEYAKSQGSKSADKYYIHFSKLADNIAQIEDRSNTSVTVLNNLTLIENIIAKLIKEEMEFNTPYIKIYIKCKQRLEEISKLAYLKVC